MMKNGPEMARFLNLLRIFRSEEGKNLTQDGESLLVFIVERNEKGISTTVSNLVASQYFGTAPTVQRKVDRLIRDSFLILTRDKNDSRKQNLLTTDKAAEYLNSLSSYIAGHNFTSS